MKRTLVISSFAVLAVSTAAAQTFDLDWNTIDGGGAMWTTGGDFELSGTIGQPDAGATMTGGSFSLTGGFWALPTGPAIHIGDLNCDGTYGYLSFADINPFVLFLSNISAWQATFPGCDPRNGDINGDGTYGQGSFADINPFVALLSDGG
jgi:hypothetical protein